MSSYRFSSATMGFYSVELFGEGQIPEPNVGNFTQEERDMFLEPQANGKIVGADANGYPVLLERPGPTPEEFLVMQSQKLQVATQLAAAQKNALTERISQINDAIDFGDATAAELAELPQRVTQLAAWKRYATLLGRVTTQEGWHMIVDWPVEPAEGMDLTVSAVAPSSSQLQ